MYYISTATNRFSTNYKNIKVTWEELVKLMQEKYIVTNETHKQYLKFDEEKQNNIKDIGGFVGGYLKGGRRKKQNIQHRQLLVLDLESDGIGITANTLKDIIDVLGFNYLVHNTHKHGPERNRLRLIIPLSREVSANEYEFICRELSDIIGFDNVDITSFQAERLMYYGSCSSDVAPILNYTTDGCEMEVEDWIDGRLNDRSVWKYQENEVEKREPGKMQQDPLEKSGLIGAFCRSWPMSRILTELFPDDYKYHSDTIWTYTKGSTVKGVKIYDDKFYYSYHQSDIEMGVLLNAYDLVLNKLFKGKKKDFHEWLLKDKDTKTELAKESFGRAESWMDDLQRNKNGKCIDSYDNLMLIIKNSNKNIMYNEFSQRVHISNGLYNDTALIDTHIELESKYGIRTTKDKLMDATQAVALENPFHPIKDYLMKVEWDKKPRVAKLLSKVFRIKSSPYIETITTKFLCGCVARIFNPGIKFDYILTLIGNEGIGKSSFCRLLAGDDYFTDDLSLYDMKDKSGAEKILGNWLVELSELHGRSKTEVEAVAAFISRQVDNYRKAFGRIAEKIPRTCCFLATTNEEEGFLMKATGNRRWWCVDMTGASKLDFEYIKNNRDQIWAEVMFLQQTEKLYIENENIEREAKLQQLKYLETFDDVSIIQEYLDIEVPEKFDKMSIYQRRSFIQSKMGYGGCLDDDLEDCKYTKRQYVCPSEVYYELYNKELHTKTKRDVSNIVTCLKKLGWRMSEKRTNIKAYGRAKMFERMA